MNVRDNPIIKVTSQGQPLTNVSTGVVTSDPIDMREFVEAIAFINMTAQTGTTPTLDCKIQYSPDYDPSNPTAGNWVDSLDTFTQMNTSTGVFFKKLSANFGRFIRLVFTPGGTLPVYTIVPTVVAKS